MDGRGRGGPGLSAQRVPPLSWFLPRQRRAAGGLGGSEGAADRVRAFCFPVPGSVKRPKAQSTEGEPPGGQGRGGGLEDLRALPEGPEFFQSIGPEGPSVPFSSFDLQFCSFAVVSQNSPSVL